MTTGANRAATMANGDSVMSSVSCSMDAECSALRAGSVCIAATDSQSVLVSDSHPYGVPVATTSDAELSSTCR
jgi:hypothetical protein